MNQQDQHVPARAAAPAPHKRRIKLILPALQFRLIGAFFGTAVLALLAQFVVLASRLSIVAAGMPSGGEALWREIPGLLFSALGISLAFLLPTIVGVGISVTFRVVGPIYRFEQHLRAIAAGEDPGVCRIREGDHLNELCGLINAAIQAAREQGVQQPAESEPLQEAA